MKNTFELIKTFLDILSDRKQDFSSMGPRAKKVGTSFELINLSKLITLLGVSLIVSLGFLTIASADHEPGHDQKVESVQDSGSQATVKVKGMVCAFCAQGIEKKFSARKEVASVKVDLDKMEVHLNYKKGMSISKDELKSIIEGSGFAFVGVNL
jgi:mercuric ion binding protein